MIIDLNLVKANLDCAMNLLLATDEGAIPRREVIGLQERAMGWIGHMPAAWQEFCDELDRVSA